MAGSDALTSPPSSSGSALLLRKVKEAETDFDRRLVQVREEGERTLARLRAETTEKLRAAQAASEGEREAALSGASGLAEAEGEEILAKARTEADAVGDTFADVASIPTPRLLSVLLEGILDADGED